jgi:N-acetylneuraminic acid mutarotase
MKAFSFFVAWLGFAAFASAATITITGDTELFDGLHGIADAAGTRIGTGQGGGVVGRMTFPDAVISGLVASGNLTALSEAFQLFGQESDGFVLNSRGPDGAFDASVIFDTRPSVNDMGGKPIWLWLYKGASRTTATEFFLVRLNVAFPTDPEGGGIELPLEVFVRPTTIASLFSGSIGPDTHDFYGPPDGLAAVLFKMQAVGAGTGNQPPTATAQSIEVFAGITRNGQLTGADPNNDPLTYELVTAPTKGMLNLTSNGIFDYTATVGQLGADSFSFKVSDGTFESLPATVSITISEAPPNAVPVAVPASFQMLRNDLLVQQLSATDADEDPLVFAKASDPTHGTLQLQSNGSFTYLPANGYVGEDAFAFTANDGIQTSAPALVVIRVGTPTPNWTWMNGGAVANLNGAYGTKGVASIGNSAGARSLAASAAEGAVSYVFGGFGRGATGGSGLLNDLWKFDADSNEWTWLSGGDTPNALGDYGEIGVSNQSNQPGGRSGALMWVAEGKLWLFGGTGRAGGSAVGELNDLWSYDLAANEWTWETGSSQVNGNGQHGVRGVASVSNVPGARTEAVGWKDGDGNLWVFGGRGRGATGSTAGLLNDLWRFDRSLGHWLHVHGPTGINGLGVYHDRASTSSQPGGRSGAVGWFDEDGALWLYGGRGMATAGRVGNLSDVWVFRPAEGTWRFMSGSDKTNVAPTYGPLGQESLSAKPGARFGMTGWRSWDGYFYLFGGSGSGVMSDVWRFNRDTQAWAWMKGHNRTNQASVYGEKGVGSVSNSPGGRSASLAFLTPNSQLWLFGGSAGALVFNDVWRLELPVVPMVELAAPTDIQTTTADLEMLIEGNSAASETTVRVEYAVAAFADQWNEVVLPVVAAGAALQMRATTLTGLASGTDYVVRARVANAAGESYSLLRRFRTTGSSPALSLAFADAGSLVDEGQGLHGVELVLSAPAVVPFVVPVTPSGSVSSADFELLTPLITFIPGQVRAVVDVRLIDNTVAQTDKTLNLTLGAPSALGGSLGIPSGLSVTLGTPVQHAVVIRDDDAGPMIAMPPAGLLVPLGGAGNFDAAASGQGPFSYQWFKGSARIARAVADTLTLSGVKLADAGEYVVEVSSARGKTLSDPAELAVVDVASRKFVAAEGGSVSLTFPFVGSGLMFEWRKMGDPAVLRTTSSLSFSALTVAQSGDYQCTVALPGVGELVSGLISLQVVNVAPTLPFNTLPVGYIGSPYQHQIEVGNAPAGGAASYVITGLPAGLVADSTGRISGIPKGVVASQTVLIRAINPIGSIIQEATISILGVPLTLLGQHLAAIDPDPSSSVLSLGGRFELTTTSAGSFTAALQLGSATLRTRGPLQVDLDGASGVATFARRNATPLTVSFELDPAAEPGVLDFSGEVADGASSVGFAGVRAAGATTDRAGAHTFGLLLDRANRGALNIPQGAGFGTATIASSGRVSFAGRTAEGSTYTAASILGREGDIPVYFSAPSSGTGNAVAGLIRHEIATASPFIHGVAGDLKWSRAVALAAARTRSYRAGFDAVAVQLTGGLYAGPTTDGIIANLPAQNNNVATSFESRAVIEGALAQTTFTVANAGGVRQRVTLPAAGSAANPAGVTFKLAARPAGSFNGGFTVAGASSALNRQASYGGQFVRIPTGDFFAAGYFLLAQPPEAGQTVRTAPELSGEVIIETAP